MRVSGYMPALKIAIGAICLSMTAVTSVMQFHPLGPHGTLARSIQFGAGASATLVGILWLVRRWPTYRQAVMFVIWADLSIAIGASMNSAPASRLCATVHFGLIGVFAAFLLGQRVLAAHCVFITAAILALAVYSVEVDHVSWLDLYIYLAPAISSAVFMPAVIQVVIDGGRRALRAIARQAIRDPMTGLNNRRGMYAAVGRLQRRTSSTILVVAVIDLDRFKEINDVRGHERGDQVLKAVGDVLRSCTRSGDIAARLGGDEFAVIAALGQHCDIDGFVERLHSHLLGIADTTTVSVGVAWERLPLESSDDIGSVLRHADRAMYEAKRQGGNRLARIAPGGAIEQS
jgi:diguanylate cyclase (GGDEF)-like protein